MVEIITEEKFNDICSKLDECVRILNGFITYMEKSNLK